MVNTSMNNQNCCLHSETLKQKLLRNFSKTWHNTLLDCIYNIPLHFCFRLKERQSTVLKIIFQMKTKTSGMNLFLQGGYCTHVKIQLTTNKKEFGKKMRETAVQEGIGCQDFLECSGIPRRPECALPASFSSLMIVCLLKITLEGPIF